MFLSTYTNKLDRKGRVSVPASFRSALSRLNGDGFDGVVLFRSHKYDALEGCGMDRLNQLAETAEGLELFSDAQDDLTASIFADARPLSFDKDGRISLPDDLAGHANLNGEACFVGRGKTFQIWEPAAFKDYQEKARARLRESGLKTT